MDNQLAPPSIYDLSAIERATLADKTKKKYSTEINKYLLAGYSLTDTDSLVAYAGRLKSSRKAFFKSALRIVTLDFEKFLKGNATPGNIKQTQAALLRIEAVRDSVTVKPSKGIKVHTWLTQKQVTDITALCADDLEGWRDWIVLGLLLGAGLRREELAALTFEALMQQPMKGGKFRDVLQVKGKGAKGRVIPIKSVLARHLGVWKETVKGGLVARSLGMGKKLGGSMSAVGIFQLVRKYGEKIGLPELAPHDLRRTYAQLGYEAGVPITQISTLLGHSSVSTTQKYLNLALDLETTVSDFIQLSGD